MKTGKNNWLVRGLCGLSLLLSWSLTGAQAQDVSVALTDDMVSATSGFISSLSEPQRSKAVFTFDAEERFNWHFIPRTRQGLPLKELDSAQLEAAMQVLRTFLSPAGVGRVEQIRSLELVLREIEVNGRFVRDPDLYFLSVFGTPSREGAWALRFEGHHIAFNWTFAGGVGMASTPHFLGSNPAEVQSGASIGLRVLGAEEDHGRALVMSLNAQQAVLAILPGEAPNDIITGNAREVTALEEVGIRYDALTEEQREMLHRLIEEIASVQPEAIAEARMAKIREQGLENLRFAWIGGTERGAAHYYRIQGPGFLIEYDNTQNDANHIHLVWRDFSGDFGTDLLRQHYDAVANPGDGHVH